MSAWRSCAPEPTRTPHGVPEGDPVQDRQVHRRAPPADRRALAGAASGCARAISAYGLPLGEAFQLRDDLLGLFGDPERTGKANADDLRGRRPTALLAETWRAAGDGERGSCGDSWAGRDVDEDGAARGAGGDAPVTHPDRVEDMITARVEEPSTPSRRSMPAPAATP